MTHRDAPATALLRDGFARVGSGVHVVLEGLDNEELSWRVAPEANPLGWLVWHLSRQQDLQVAHLAGVERSHMGKIERGEHMPTLAMILKIARALGRSASELMLETEARLPPEPVQP